MLKISRLADYATIILNFLAKAPEGCFSAAVISEGVKVNPPTVSKILKMLAEAGLVTSTRGSAGGYCIARPAEEITLAQIITSIDGMPALTDCAKSGGQCMIDSDCHLRSNWQTINKIVFDVLEKYSLKDMGQRLSV